MILKIEIIIKDIKQYISKLSTDFDILCLKNLYISPKGYMEDFTIEQFREMYNIDKLVKISFVDETNLSNEEYRVVNWCRDKFVEQDLKRFEKNKQDEIQNYLNILNNFEQELKKYKDGGEISGN